MNNLKRLSFDTSAISGHNGLAMHDDRDFLVTGIRVGYFTRLTFPSVEESLAISDPTKRADIFGLLSQLLGEGECLLAHNSLATHLIQNYDQSGHSRWDSMNIRFPRCETAIQQSEFSQSESDEQREFAEQEKVRFAEVFINAAPHFEEVFATGVERPATADEFFAHLNREGGALWNFGAGLYERAASRRPTEAQVRAFADECPPFLCLLLGLVHGQFEWAIRGDKVSAQKRPNRIDLFSAIYLPYCDIYVTEDAEQRRCLREIAITAKLPVEVISFAGFAHRLLPLAFLSTTA